MVAFGFFVQVWSLLAVSVNSPDQLSRQESTFGFSTTMTEFGQFVSVERTAGQVRMLLLMFCIESNPGPPETKHTILQVSSMHAEPDPRQVVLEDSLSFYQHIQVRLKIFYLKMMKVSDH